MISRKLKPSRKAPVSESSDEPGVDISSLIDVCFLLLIFFLVTATIVPREQDLDMKLPSPISEIDVPDIRPLLIQLKANGDIYLKAESAPAELIETNAAGRELPQLGKRLTIYASAARNSQSTALVQVDADPEARHQRVIDILNTLTSSGITNVTFPDFQKRK